MMIHDIATLHESNVAGSKSSTVQDAVSSLFDVEFDTALEVASGDLLSGNIEVPPVEIGRAGGLSLNGEDGQLASFRDRTSEVDAIDSVQKITPVSISNDQRPPPAKVAPNSTQGPARSPDPQAVGLNQTREHFSNRENSGHFEIGPHQKVNGLAPRIVTNDSAEGPIRAEDNPKRQPIPERALTEDALRKGSTEPDHKKGPAIAADAKPEVQGKPQTIADPRNEKAKPIIPEQVTTADRPAQIPSPDAAPEVFFAGDEIQSTPRLDEKIARDTLVPSPANERSGIKRAHGFLLPETGLAPTNRPFLAVPESVIGMRDAAPSPGIGVSFPKDSESDIRVSIIPKVNESAVPQAQDRRYFGDAPTAIIARRLPDSPDQLRGDPPQIKENEVGAAVRGEKPAAVESDPRQGNATQISKLPVSLIDVPRHMLVTFNKEDHGEFASMIAKQDADIDLNTAKVGRSSGIVTMPQEPPRPVVHQLVDAARTTTGGTIEVKLAPEELGRVKLSLTPSEAGLAVTIIAERPETLDLIRRNIEVFAQELRHQGHQSLTFQFGQDGGQGRNQPTRDDHSEMNDKKDHEHASYRKSQPTLQPVLNGRLDLRI